MPNPAPRPCWHTGFAIVAVLVAGLMLGAFTKPRGQEPQTPPAAHMLAPATR